MCDCYEFLRQIYYCNNFIVSKGISASRILAIGYGEEKPVASNKTIEGRSQNRRVEFELYLK